MTSAFRVALATWRRQELATSLSAISPPVLAVLGAIALIQISLFVIALTTLYRAHGESDVLASGSLPLPYVVQARP